MQCFVKLRETKCMSYRGQISDLIRETSSIKTMQINFTVIVFNEKEYNRLV